MIMRRANFGHSFSGTRPSRIIRNKNDYGRHGFVAGDQGTEVPSQPYRGVESLPLRQFLNPIRHFLLVRNP
jgi:hypothetical protein